MALDFSSLEEATQAVRLLKNHVGMFKIGLELFVKEGPRAVREIQRIAENGVFLDLKFFDIPETVRRAMAVLKPFSDGIRFITVHAAGGAAMLKAVVEEAGGKNQVLGVTILTSTHGGVGRGQPGTESVEDRVVEFARGAKESGCAGVVCSSGEARSVKEACGQSFIVVTPGIRPGWANVTADDQARVMTPREAISNGADYLVIGRPITRANDPVKAADQIAQEIDEALRS